MLIHCVSWIKLYNLQLLRQDIVAGITLTAVVIPQSIAYAFLAGIPAAYGLYTAIIPVFIYTILGTSKHTSVGTFALISLVINAASTKISISVFSCIDETSDNNNDTSCPVDLIVSIVLALTFIGGVFELVLALFRVGGFISKHLLHDCFVSGLTTAAAFHIATSQVETFFKLPKSKSNEFFTLIFTWKQILVNIFSKTHVPTFLVGSLTIGVVYLIRYVNENFYVWIDKLKSFLLSRQQQQQPPDGSIGRTTIINSEYSPSPRPHDEEEALLITSSPTSTLRPSSTTSQTGTSKRQLLIPDIFCAIVIATIVSLIFNARASDGNQIGIIGSIPRGFPSPRFSLIPSDYCKFLPADSKCPDPLVYISALIMPAIKVALVSITLSLAVAQLFAKKMNYEGEIDLNQELFALGCANSIGSLLGQSFVASGSLSRTALSVKAGAATQITAFISALMTMIVIVSPLTDILRHIPKTALAAVVIIAVVALFSQIQEGITLIKLSLKKDNTQEYLFRRAEAALWWSTFLGVLLFDIDVGIAIGMVLSIVNVIWTKFIPRFKKLALFRIRDYNHAEDKNAYMGASFQYLHQDHGHFDINESCEYGFFALGSFEVDGNRDNRHGIFNAGKVPKELLYLSSDYYDGMDRQMIIRDMVQMPEDTKIAFLQFDAPKFLERPIVLKLLLQLNLRSFQTDSGHFPGFIVFIPRSYQFRRDDLVSISELFPFARLRFVLKDDDYFNTVNDNQELDIISRRMMDSFRSVMKIVAT